MHKADHPKDRGVREGPSPGKTVGETAIRLDDIELLPIEEMSISITVGSKAKARDKASTWTQAQPKRSQVYRRLFRSSLGKRVDIVKSGVGAETVRILAGDLHYEQGVLIDRLGFSRATISRKIKAGKRLDLAASERVVGAMRLIGQVQHMVEESGDARGFDASAWVGKWLEQPLPALAGRAPAEFMNSATGQELVAQLLAQTQSGAYA